MTHFVGVVKMHDFWEFLKSVFWHWQSWLGGTGFGGAVVVFAALYERLSGRSMSKRMHVIVFIVCFLFGAFFMSWRDEYQARNKAEQELQRLTIPDLKGEFTYELAGPAGEDNGGSIITLGIGIENVGAPSIAKNFKVTVLPSGKEPVSAQLIPPALGPTKLLFATPDGQEQGVQFISSDYLPRKVGDNLIPTNGRSEGFLICFVSTVTRERFFQGDTRVRVEFDDARGKHYAIEKAMRRGTLPVNPNTLQRHKDH